MDGKTEVVEMPQDPETNSKAEQTDLIPLEKIRFDVEVKGTLAQVKVIQEFGNKSQKPIEAVYTFPIPDEAVVVDCEMKIGGKTVKAELKEKEEARKTYEEARDEGHHASLLEQEEEDIFTMSVAGIEPGEEITVTTTYQQRVPWQTGGGRLVIPTVVPPIFISGAPTGQKTGTGWAEDTDEVPNASKITPHFTNKAKGEEISYSFDIKVNLDAGFDCKVSSPSHPMLGTIFGTKESPVEFSSQDLIPNRDFIICYQSKDDKVATGVHRGKFDSEDFSLISLIPPGNVETKPKDIMFMVDVSGSMEGIKKKGAEKILKKMLGKLWSQHPDVRFGILAFDTKFYSIRNLGVIGEKEDFAELVKKLDKVGGGGTETGRALDHCFAQLAEVQVPEREQYILLLTDGDTTSEAKNIKPGIRVISCGIDTALREKTIRDIARKTGGTSIGIYPGEDYNRAANTLLGLLSGPVLRDVKIPDCDCDTVGIQDVYMGMPANILIRDINGDLPETVIIEGLDSTGKKIQIPINLKDAGECSFAAKLWAREKLREPEMKRDEQIALSLKYRVICKFTSFVAIMLKEVPGQKPEKVEVKVEFPEGWNYDRFDGRGTSICLLGMTPRGGPNAKGLSGLGRDVKYFLGPPSQRGSSGRHGLFSTGFDEDEDIHEFGAAEELLTTIEEILPEKSTPFQFASQDLFDKLCELANFIELGIASDTEETEIWQKLSKEITIETMKNWTIEQKMQSFYLLLSIRSYGLEVSDDLLAELFKIKPDKDQEPKAYNWWVRAMQKAGIKVS